MLNTYTFRVLRSVSAVDAVPTSASKAADAAVKALTFHKILGRTPILLAEFTGANQTATLQVFCRDTVRDFGNAANDNNQVLTWMATINLTDAVTRLPLDHVGYGSEIFIAVSALGASTTLDLSVADGLKNN